MTANGKQTGSFTVLQGLCLYVGLGIIAPPLARLVSSGPPGSLQVFGAGLALIALMALCVISLFQAIRWGTMSIIIAVVLMFAALFVGSYIGLLLANLLSGL